MNKKGLNNVVLISSMDIPKYVMKFREKRKVLAVMGAPGIGKTKAIEESAEQIAKKLGKNLVTNPTVESWKNPNNFCVSVVLTSVIEETDVIGYPHVTNDNGEIVARYALNELFPIEGCGIIFFDEFPNGRSSVQNALQRILLEHRIGNYKISPDIQFIVAGNRPSDNCGTYNIPAALRNRIGWMEVTRPKIESWLDKMEEIGKPINPTIAAWMLSIGSKYFDNFDPKAEQYAYGTTRSVTMASELIEDEKDYEIISKLAGSFIGADAGQDLVEFMKLTEKVDINELLQDATQIHKYETDMGMLYSISVTLIDKCNDNPKILDNVLAIISETKKKEHGVFIIKGLMTRWGKAKTLERIMKTKNYKDVMEKYYLLLKTD